MQIISYFQKSVGICDSGIKLHQENIMYQKRIQNSDHSAVLLKKYPNAE